MARRNLPVKAVKTQSDLELWDENVLQGTITHLPAKFRLRELEMMPRSYRECVDIYQNGTNESERKDAEIALRRVAWKVLTLMRLDSGLEFTAAMPSAWPTDELERPNWGNGFTPSTNPLNPRNNQNTISPRPGNNYRNMLLNWELIVAKLYFWDPAQNPRVNAEDIKRQEETSIRRRDALKVMAECDNLDAKFFKELKAYTASLTSEINDENKRKAKALRDLEPVVQGEA